MAFRKTSTARPKSADLAFELLGSMLAELEMRTGFKVEKAERAIGEDESFRQWCERLALAGLKVDGKPFKLDDRPALIPIYDAIPTYREQAKGLILVIQKATQLGLTIWEVLANIYMAVKWEPVSIGMFMPAQATAIHKSEHRFMRIVRSAPSLYGILTMGRGVDGKQQKVGEGNVLTRRVGESLLLFLWTSGKVTTESVPMDVVTLDEVQEMPLDQIDKVQARMGDSEIQFMMLLSTANMPDLDINYWYLLGNQQVWHTECETCGELSDLSDPAGNFPDKSIAYDEVASTYFWRCPACGGRISDPQRGRYVATNPKAAPHIRSFLLPRTISPKLTPGAMLESWMRAKTGNQRKSFYNRTLARPYIDADQLPVTMAHCEAAEAAGKALGLVWETSGRDCYMGIDQMGSFNAVIIKKRLPDGRQAVVHVEAVFNNDPFERCAKLMDQFNVLVCVVEQLPNVNDARRFANQFPGRVFLAGYSALRDDAMHWGDDLTKSDSRTAEDARSRYTVTLNQYKCMQTSLFRIRGEMVKGRMVPMCLFPDSMALEQDVIENGKTRRIPLLRDWVFVHFTKTALVIEEDEDERKTLAKVHKVGIDPHYSYANMLCDVAWARSYGTTTFILPEAKVKDDNTAKAERMNMHGLPRDIAASIVEHPAGRVCGNCSAYEKRDDRSGWCEERRLIIQLRDPGCPMFDGPED